MNARSAGLLTLLALLFVGVLFPERCAAQTAFATGDRVILESLGTIAGPRWLDGRTLDGTVGLAPAFDGQFSGATWELVQIAGDMYSLKTLGFIEGPRWLACRPNAGTVSLIASSLTRHPVGATNALTLRWHVVLLDRDVVGLRCDGDAQRPAWLDGHTQTGSVGLAPATTLPFSGARWRVHDVRPQDVLTGRNDTFRTGADSAETILSPALLRANRFGKLFTRTVEGQIYAQPLYRGDLTIRNARHNTIFVATAANYVYAFDADHPEMRAPLWRSVQLGAPVPWTDLVPDTLIEPLIGIISTPVIDPATMTLYVVAKSKTVQTIVQDADLRDNDTVTLQTLGTVPGATWLDAHTGDGSVALAPAFGGLAFSGTWWEVHRGGALALRSLGRAGGNALWLDGRTANATVGLAPTTAPPFSGTAWKLVDAGSGGVALQTQGTIPGARFLDGRTRDGSVGLAPNFAAPYTGARWHLQRHVYHNTLYALNLLTGAIKGRVEIGGSSGATVFDPKWQLNRPALLLQDNIVYVAFGAHADHGPFNGWVFAYRATDLGPSGTFASLPGGNGGGIWQSGSGLTGDGAGNVYLMTGNGTAAPGAIDYSNSLLKLRPAAGQLHVVDAFHAAAGQAFDMNVCDLDLGSSGPVHLPGTSEIVGVGKQGILYTLDEGAMSRPLMQFPVAQNQYQPVSSRCTQWGDVETWPHVHGSPVVWRTSPSTHELFVWPEEDRLRGYIFEHGRMDPAPFATSADSAPAKSMPGGMLALSADGDSRESAIVWGTRPSDCPPGATTIEDARPCNAQFNVVPGVLKAFDASTLTELWSSDAPQDRIGMLAKFSPPTVTHGKVYIGTFGANCSAAACPSDVIVFGVRPGM